MLGPDDHRWSLLPTPDKGLFLHVPAGEGTDDEVLGPFPSKGGAVERRRLSFLDEAGPSVPYERATADEVSSVAKQRRQVDDRLDYVGTPSEDVANAFLPVLEEFRTCIDVVFARVVCSMTRIVMSAGGDDYGGWIVATARDKEKVPGECPTVCYLRRNSGYVEWMGDRSSPPTSSGIMAAEFHSLVGRSGLLLHTHPVFAVLVDRPVDGAKLLENAPRSSEFAREIAEAVRSRRVAFRRGEGIWTFGQSGAEAARQAQLYQTCALQQIAEERQLTD